MKSFLQTKEWLDFQKEAGHKTWRFDDGKIVANIIKLGLPLGKSMLYIPHGPEIDFEHIKGGVKNELGIFLKYLKDLSYEEGAIFAKIEPLSDMVTELIYRRGFKRSSKQIQPYLTVVLGLDRSEDELLVKMHSKTRYNIKVAEKHGIKTRSGGNVDEFWKLLQKTTERDKFSSHSKNYYEKLLNFLKEKGEIKTDIILAEHDGKPVAGAIVLIYQDTGYYLHGASDYEYRAMMAPYALHWEIIKWLRKHGIRHYDFWGVDAKRWPGVTRFKFGWGGDLKEYPGSFDMPISWVWYLSYLVARKFL